MFRITALVVVSIVLLASASSLVAGEYRDYDPHSLGIFVGDTRFDGNNGLTLGAGYEYRWKATVGIGVLFEYVSSDRLMREYVVGIPFRAHPYGGLSLAFVPLYTSEEDDEGNSVARGAVRVGVAYAIDACGFIITPEVNFDFKNDTAYTVYGLILGMSF